MRKLENGRQSGATNERTRQARTSAADNQTRRASLACFVRYVVIIAYNGNITRAVKRVARSQDGAWFSVGDRGVASLRPSALSPPQLFGDLRNGNIIGSSESEDAATVGVSAHVDGKAAWIRKDKNGYEKIRFGKMAAAGALGGGVV